MLRCIFFHVVLSVLIRDAVNDEVPANVSKSSGPVILSLLPTMSCYTCYNCTHVNVNLTTTKTCPYHFDSSKINKCVTYSEKYTNLENEKHVWVVRGCVSERGSCDEIKKAFSENNPNFMTLEDCNECEGDKCNSVSRSLSDLITTFFAVVVTPVIVKCTLS